MKRQYVDMIEEGDDVSDYFLATRKDLRTTANGRKFLGMVFKDKTGDIGGIHWTNPDGLASNFDVGDVVQVRGKVHTYQSRLQIRVETVSALREGDYDEQELVDVPIDVGSIEEQFRTLLATVKEEHLSQLVNAFVTDDAFMKAFTAASAGKRWHHGYRGGLMEHCLEMARLVDAICQVYPELNRDLMLAAVLVHDAGKVEELTQDMAVEYTDAGKLIGHIVIGAQMVEDRIRTIPGFPETLRLHLVHIVLSHHGLLENGSPVVPKSKEALAFNRIDDLSAQMNAWGRVIEETQSRGDTWSEFLGLIGQQVWSGE